MLITGLLAATILAAPKDCGTDITCFVDAAATCSAAKLVSNDVDPMKTVRITNVKLTGTMTFTLEPMDDGRCKVQSDRVITSVSGKPVDTADKQAKILATMSETPLNHLTCLASRAEAAENLKTLGLKAVGGEQWMHCFPTGCPDPAIPEAGCSWTPCAAGRQQLQCKEGDTYQSCSIDSYLRNQVTPSLRCTVKCGKRDRKHWVIETCPKPNAKSGQSLGR